MASPVDQDRVGTNSAASTSHSLNLPGSIASGDYLLAVVRCAASTTITWPAGWTEWAQSTADASDDETSIAWRLADGTEGATITITLGTSRILVGLCYRVTGANGISFSAVAPVTGSASQPNPPAIGPYAVSRDLLVIPIGGCDDSETLSSAPTNYVNGAIQGSTATGSAGSTVYGASRQITATTENPGAFTLGSTSNWTCWTVAFSDVEFPVRLSQEPAEVVVQPDTQEARTSQVPVEVVVQPDTQKLRLSQIAVEVVVLADPFTPRPGFRAYIID